MIAQLNHSEHNDIHYKQKLHSKVTDIYPPLDFLDYQYENSFFDQEGQELIYPIQAFQQQHTQIPGGYIQNSTQQDKSQEDMIQTTTQCTTQSSINQVQSSQSLDALPFYYINQQDIAEIPKKKPTKQGRKQKQPIEYIGTSTFHSIKTIRNYKQQMKKFRKNKKNKENECGFTLFVKQVPDREIFFLIGDIIVEPNFRQEWYSVGDPSPFNYYKSLVCNILFKERKILQSDYSQSNKGLMNFSNIVQILKSYPDQDTHDYGLILEEYEQRCKELNNIGNIMKMQPDFTIFKEIQDQQYLEFTKRCHKYIDESRVEKGEFFFYAICKLDFDRFCFDIQSFGVSEAMSQLLGLELESLSSLIQKKGLISSFSNCTRQMIMKNFIQALSKKQQNNCKDEDSDDTSDISEASKINLTVHTFDGLSVNVEGHFHSLYDRSKDFSLIPFTEIMSMVHVKIDERVLAMVKSMRCDKQTDVDILHNSGEDLYYNLQSQIFYDKFYACNQDIPQENQQLEIEEIKKKTCNYRTIN